MNISLFRGSNHLYNSYVLAQVKCTQTDYCSKSFDSFLDLILEIDWQLIQEFLLHISLFCAQVNVSFLFKRINNKILFSCVKDTAMM